MKIRNLLLLLLLISTLGFGQEKVENKSWIIKFNPTHTIDFFTFPAVTFAVEKRFTRSFGLNFEIGNQFYEFRNKDVDTIFKKSKGIKTNIEGRWYLISESNSDPSGFYSGLQMFYRQNQFTRSVTYSREEGGENTNSYLDEFGVKKTAFGTIFIIGYQYIAPCNIIIESYCGWGWMNRQIKNYNREFDKSKDVIVEGVDQLFNRASVDLEEASGNTIILAIGVRLGYRF